MNPVPVTFKALQPDTIIPKYVHEGDAGMDLYAREHRTLEQGEPYMFRLGFASEFPSGWAAIFQDRSSMGKRGVRVLGGVIDSGYRGEWACVLVNLTDKEIVINKGDRIAQVLFMPVGTAVQEESDLSETARGDGGFGSTGK